LRRELVSFVLGVLHRLFHAHQDVLTLLQACALPFGGGLGHLLLLRLDLLGSLVDPLLGRLQRLIELLTRAVLMPVRSDNLFTALVGIERAMVDHAFATVFLYLVALSVHPWPLGRLQGGCDLWGSPVHQGLALRRLDQDKMPGIFGPGHFPRPALHPGAILQGAHGRRLKAVQAMRLVVIEH